MSKERAVSVEERLEALGEGKGDKEELVEEMMSDLGFYNDKKFVRRAEALVEGEMAFPSHELLLEQLKISSNTMKADGNTKEFTKHMRMLWDLQIVLIMAIRKADEASKIVQDMMPALENNSLDEKLDHYSDLLVKFEKSENNLEEVLDEVCWEAGVLEDKISRMENVRQDKKEDLIRNLEKMKDRSINSEISEQDRKEAMILLSN